MPGDNQGLKNCSGGGGGVGASREVRGKPIVQYREQNRITSGAIIGDGDRKSVGMRADP